jgi:hypothetical protein
VPVVVIRSAARRGAVVVLPALLAAGLLSAAPAATAADPSPVLNEIACEGTDWVEITNPAAAPVDVSGWLLTDTTLDDTDPGHRYLLPASTVLAPGDHLVLTKGSGGFGFGISCGSDTVRLADSSLAQVDDAAVPDNTGHETHTWGRLPDGTGAWSWTEPTAGTANAAAAEGPDEPDADPSWLFDPLVVNEIDLAIPPAGIESLNAWPDTYTDATITVRRTGHDPQVLAVGVRLKGNASFRTLEGKAAFKIKVNHSVPGQRLAGLRSLTLNNMLQDPSMLAEAVTAKVFADFGVPSARVGYAYVRVNGADFGLYSNVESINEDFAADRFATTQHLYEGERAVDVTPTAVAGFEVDAGSSDDTSDLQALVTAAGTPAAGWLAAVSARLDLDEAVRAWAAEHTASHWDGYSVAEPNNYYLHSDASGRFSMIPSGTDQSWDNPVDFGDRGEGVLFDSCITDPTCRAAYVDTLTDHAPLIASSAWSDLAAAIDTAITPWRTLDPRKEMSPDDPDFGAAAKRAHIAARGAQLAAGLAAPTFDGVLPGGSGGGSTGGTGGGGAVEPVLPAPAQPVTAPPAVPPAGAPTVPVTTPAPATAVLDLTVARRAPVTTVHRLLRRTVRTAPRASLVLSEPTRLRLRAHPATGSASTWIRIDRTWHNLGRSVRSADGRVTTRAFALTRPGEYLLRVRTDGGWRYLILRVPV